MGDKIHRFLGGCDDANSCNACFLYFFAAFFNITSRIMKTNQTFNVTVQDSCNADYKVDFGDGTTISLTSAQKIVSHSYINPGNYNIQLQSGSAPAECKNAAISVEVRDPIQNMVRNLFLALFTTKQIYKKKQRKLQRITIPYHIPSH